jgi:hypothetical protein
MVTFPAQIDTDDSKIEEIMVYQSSHCLYSPLKKDLKRRDAHAE